jgi:demethylmenaquinone methyltransferase/2-methoxy-6-polyprenyl-1,4-benzoquinol methylase
VENTRQPAAGDPNLEFPAVAHVRGHIDVTDQHHLERGEPHPVLAGYYERRDQRRAFVRKLFDEAAPHYDRINEIFSFGTGARYRRDCLRRAGLRPGLTLADIATGTGLVAREAVGILGGEDGVVGVDVSMAMLAEARCKLGIPLIQGIAEQLPFAEGSVDFLTMGYALRHVSDLFATFGEFHRVLRPGGTVLVLEIAKPTKRVNNAFLSAYLGGIVPLLSRWIAGRRIGGTLMRYYWDTIEQCVPPETILAAIRKAGFEDTRCTTDFGICRSYSGRKPNADHGR